MQNYVEKISKSSIIKLFPIIYFVVHITACDIAHHCKEMAQLSIGISKTDVIRIMGREPASYSALRNTEYITYGCRGNDAVIRFIDGKLEAYGRVGDFDLTKDPSINVKLKTDITTHEDKK